MWGNYFGAPKRVQPEGWAYAYRGEGWSTDLHFVDHLPDSDLGLWAYQNSQGNSTIPEPSSAALLTVAAAAPLVSVESYRIHGRILAVIQQRLQSAADVP